MSRHIAMTMQENIYIGTIVLCSICATGAIRNLKDGPVIGPDSRQYKTFSLPNDPTNEFDDFAVKAAPVQVLCTEQNMIVLISADLHSNGRRVAAEELSLGGRSTEDCKASQYSDTQYVIKADLHQCGSELSIDEDHLVYSNQLVYTPRQNGVGIVRASCASIPVECHYKRTHFVSSTDVKPPWAQFETTKSETESFQFSFQLMNDDWSNKRSSCVYQFGDMMNIQASFSMTENAPFRLVMDSCLVTLEPNTASLPCYTLIQNHGCLVDSKVVDSRACFMPRKQSNVLQMQVDAFRFHGDTRNTIYITCQLRIVDLELNIMNKACTYSGHRWLSVDGRDEVCDCCENTCDVINQKQTDQWSRLQTSSASRDPESNTVTLGPITILS